MKARYVLALIIAILLITCAAACDKDSSGSGDGEKGPAMEVFLMCTDFQEGAQEMVRKFNEIYNGNAELTVLTTPSTAEAIQPRAAAGAMPAVMSIDADSFGRMIADEGLLVDLNNYPEIPANVIPALIPPYTSAGGVFYGVAGGYATSFLYVNDDLFAKAGLTAGENDPTNWPEFLDLCQKLLDAGIAPVTVAGNASFSQYPNTFWTAGMSTFFLAQGVDYGTKILNGTMNFDVPEYAMVYKRPLELMERNFFIPGVLNLDSPGANDAWLQGESAMLYGGSWLAGPMFADADFPISIMMPTLNEPGQGIGLPAGVETGFAAANNDTAEWNVKFIDYMTNGEGFYVYQNARANLPYILNFDASRVVAEEPVANYMEYMNSHPNVYAGPFWFMVLQSEMFDILPRSFSSVLAGEITPEQAASQFHAEFIATLP